jgi:hypothetical protein
MSSKPSNQTLTTLGEILVKDYLLLEEHVLKQSDLKRQLETHLHYLINQNFKEFRLMIPHDTSDAITKALEDFIQSAPIKGAIRHYLKVNNTTKFSEQLTINPEVAFKHWLCILPSEDFRYDSLRKKIWNLAQDGKSIMILMPERVREWKGHTSYLKRIHIKGANFAMSGSYQYRWGFWHKKNLKEIHKSKLVSMWITPAICNLNDAKCKKDIQCKLEILSELKTLPNDL